MNKYLIAIALLVGLSVSGQPTSSPKYEGCRKTDTPAMCSPPTTLPVHFFTTMQPPYDVALKFGGTRVSGGEVMWIWLKASESKRKCTAAELKIGRAHINACNKRVGEEIMQSSRFKMVTTTPKR